MQSSNQSATGVEQDTPFLARSLDAGPGPTNGLGESACDTEDDRGMTADVSPAAANAPATRSAAERALDAEECEAILWEARTSAKIFLVGLLFGGAITTAWVGLAVTTWGFGYENLALLTYAGGLALLIFWAVKGLRLFRAIHSHHYRLTTRRLFVTSGLIRRRIDQIELLRVKDLYVRQSMLGNWLGVGHVILISSEQTLPRAILYGIERPRHVMDLIWRQTRLELDRKTSRIESV